jgi:hypothetical protein
MAIKAGMQITIIDRQRQIVESIQFSDDSSICLILEHNLQAQTEELEVSLFKHVGRKISFYSVRDSKKISCHPSLNDLPCIGQHFISNDMS